jgi:AbrB family looped-hinge helix DNA binding protein
MEIRVSTKGQVVLPDPLRRRLGILAGDLLDVQIKPDVLS